MKSIRERALKGEVLGGTWSILASSVSAEIQGKAGFDWVLLDLEHGMGDLGTLLHQLQALDGTPAAPIVRVAWNDPTMVKRALDLGPAGIMIPYVNTAEEATLAARAVRYPPQGIRGLTPLSRGAEFGLKLDEYFREANDKLITVVQIETEQAVNNAEAIAAVDGVDVLFVGPMDLSLGMGIYRDFQHPRFQEALAKVARACKKAGKAAGILLLNADRLDQTVGDGFTFVAMSSDGGELATSMSRLAKPFEKFR